MILYYKEMKVREGDKEEENELNGKKETIIME